MFKPTSWVELKPAGTPPQPRCGHSSIIVNREKLYLLGGNEENSNFETSKRYNRLYEYNISTNFWRQISIPKMPPKIGESYIYHENYIYCVTSESRGLARIERIKPETGEWKIYSVSEDFFCSTSTKSILYNGSIITFGGFVGRFYDMSNRILEFEIKTKKWREWKIIGAPSGRALYSSAISKNILYIYGGYGEDDDLEDGTVTYDDFYQFNLETKHWKKVEYSGIGPGARRSHMMINHKDVEIILYGGYDGKKFLNDLWCFDIDKKLWRTIDFRESIQNPTGRRYFSYSTTDEGIFIFGGMAQSNMYQEGCLNDDFYLLCDASEKYLFFQNLKCSFAHFNDVTIFIQ
eukprot:gene12583-6403_t